MRCFWVALGGAVIAAAALLSLPRGAGRLAAPPAAPAATVRREAAPVASPVAA